MLRVHLVLFHWVILAVQLQFVSVLDSRVCEQQTHIILTI